MWSGLIVNAMLFYAAHRSSGRWSMVEVDLAIFYCSSARLSISDARSRIVHPPKDHDFAVMDTTSRSCLIICCSGITTERTPPFVCTNTYECLPLQCFLTYLGRIIYPLSTSRRSPNFLTHLHSVLMFVELKPESIQDTYGFRFESSPFFFA